MSVASGRVAAVRVAPLAAGRLAAAGGGRVVARFPRTVTIELSPGDAAAGTAWVSLHPPGPVPSPFGIAGGRWPLASARVGAPVTVERRAGCVAALRVGGRARLPLGRAVAADTHVPVGTPPPPLGTLLPRALAGIRDGLLPLAPALLAVPDVAPVAVSPLAAALRAAAAPALRGLARATAAGDPEAWLAAAAGLVGLGPGLTPAGDDTLLGWVIALRAGGAPRDAELLQAVARPLTRLAGRGTTPLSQALLAAALAGHLSEPAAAFVRRPDRARLTALLALGATSGGDFLLGYGLARGVRRDGRAAA